MINSLRYCFISPPSVKVAHYHSVVGIFGFAGIDGASFYLFAYPYLVDPEKWNLISGSVRPADSHFAECVAQARFEYSCGCVTSRHVEVTAEYYWDTFREIVER